MLDLIRIRNNPQEVAAALSKKGCIVDFAEVIKLDDARKDIINEVEALKAKRNAVSKSIPQLKKEGKDVEPIFQEMRDIGDKITELDAKLEDVKLQFFLVAIKRLLIQSSIMNGLFIRMAQKKRHLTCFYSHLKTAKKSLSYLLNG